MTGAYGPLGHGSFLPIIEHLMHHFISIIKRIQIQNIKSLAPRKEVCEAFVGHADLYLKRTAWTSGCRSWFKQGKVDGPLSIWPGTRLVFFDLLSDPRYEDYDITYLGGNPFGFMGNGFSVREYDGSDLSYYLGTTENPGVLLPSHHISDLKQSNNQLPNGTNLQHIDEENAKGRPKDKEQKQDTPTNGVQAH